MAWQWCGIAAAITVGMWVIVALVRRWDAGEKAVSMPHGSWESTGLGQ